MTIYLCVCGLSTSSYKVTQIPSWDSALMTSFILITSQRPDSKHHDDLGFHPLLLTYDFGD
jgi:hypothetical protein